MTFGSLLRTPPRRRFAHRRIAALLCMALLAVPVGAAPAEAYPCGERAARSLTAAGGAECEAPAKPKRKAKTGEPNMVSLAVFVAVIFGALALPLNNSRRARDQ
jgi:hypothetical protein